MLWFQGIRYPWKVYLEQVSLFPSNWSQISLGKDGGIITVFISYSIVGWGLSLFNHWVSGSKTGSASETF